MRVDERHHHYARDRDQHLGPAEGPTLDSLMRSLARALPVFLIPASTALLLFLTPSGLAQCAAEQRPSHPSTDHLDFEMDPVDSTTIDSNGNCIPDHLERPKFGGFTLSTIHGPRDTISTPIQLYCYPAVGSRSDSLVLYIYPCDPHTVQVRLYSSTSQLCQVIPVLVECPATAYAELAHFTLSSRQLVVEVVTSQRRFVRRVTLGAQH